MSNMPNRVAGEPAGIPDPDAQDLAAKQNIPIEDAERIIRERGNDRGEVDATAQEEKLDKTN